MYSPFPCHSHQSSPSAVPWEYHHTPASGPLHSLFPLPALLLQVLCLYPGHHTTYGSPSDPYSLSPLPCFASLSAFTTSDIHLFPHLYVCCLPSPTSTVASINGDTVLSSVMSLRAIAVPGTLWVLSKVFLNK